MSTAPTTTHPARKPLIVWIWILTAMIVATAVALVLAIRGDIRFGEMMPNEIRLETASSLGDAPFSATPLADAPDPSIALATSTGAVQPAGAATATGGTPGLYGGSNDMGRCDVGQLKTFLGANPDKAKAWVDALNRDPLLSWENGLLKVTDIPAYIDTLTSVILVSDTRVTNHGYLNGKATPFQVVLQKGTAVLVDKYGVPRAKCFCGNPLLPPQRPGQPFNPGKVEQGNTGSGGGTTPGGSGGAVCFDAPEAGIHCDEGSDPNPDTTYVGDPWEDFTPDEVVAVQPVVEAIDEFEVRVPATPEGELTTIQAGCESSGTCGDSSGATPEPEVPVATAPNGPPTPPDGAICTPDPTAPVTISIKVVNNSGQFVDLWYTDATCTSSHLRDATMEPGAVWEFTTTIGLSYAATAGSSTIIDEITWASDGETWTIE